MKSENGRIYGLTLLYFVISLLGILHHELWLDECQGWLLARDSHSLPALFQNTRYEGHPLIWHLLLFGLTRLTWNPVWMQVLHILISTSVVYLFLRKSPFGWIFKLMFIFGYFMIFEYNVLSRNYMPGVLFLFLACADVQNRETSFTPLAFFLALASNVHLIFLVVACVLFTTLIFDQFENRKAVGFRRFVPGYFIFALGIILTIVQVFPPGDTLFFDHIQPLTFSEKLKKGFIAPFLGIFPLPDFRTIEFWNTNLVVNVSKPFAALLGCFTYLIPLVLFHRNAKSMAFVYIAMVGMFMFFYLTQMSATRYDGILYFIFIVGLWISHYFPDQKIPSLGFLNRPLTTRVNRFVVYGILGLQLVCGIYAYGLDIQYPFTTTKATVAYLQKHKLDQLPMVGFSLEGTCLSPYLRRKVWSLCHGREESFSRWNMDCQVKNSADEVVPLLCRYMATRKRAVYISVDPILPNLTTHDWVDLDKRIRIRQLYHAQGPFILRNYRYFIFEVVAK